MKKLCVYLAFGLAILVGMVLGYVLRGEVQLVNWERDG